MPYLATRFYIWAYERFVTVRGQRNLLRKKLQSKMDFASWKEAAEELDEYLGNDNWKKTDDYAYYDHSTVRRVKEQLHSSRLRAVETEGQDGKSAMEAVGQLKALVEASVKNNIFGTENPRL